MLSRFRFTLTIAAILSLMLALTLGGGVALGAETVLSAELAGSADTDEDGTGSARVTLDPDAGTACWELSAENIDPVMVSHIHVGGEGETGDVVVDLDVDGFEGTSDGCTEDVEAATLQEIVDDPQGYYVNLHTEPFPSGAIRGQLLGGSEPPNTALPAADAASALAVIGVVLLGMAVLTGVRILRPVSRRG